VWTASPVGSLMAGALDGLRVIDLSQMIAGPYCTQLLADLGADVIKVEDPATAPSRRKGRSPPVKAVDGSITTFAAYWLSANRNKRAASLDLKLKEGREALRELVAASDIVVENLSSRAQASLGLKYSWATQARPDVIWASLTGVGRTGPDADRGGWDLLAQPRSGLMSLAGPRDGPPMKSGTSLIDYIGGLHLAVAVLAAVRHRERTGEGQFIDVALLDCAVACLDGFPLWPTIAGVVPERNGNHNPMKFAAMRYTKPATATSRLERLLDPSGSGWLQR
jgi:glutaryl-CoA transferase